MRRLLLLIFSLAFAASAFAQPYKWVDQNGKVQYGDAPPPGVKATPLRPQPAPATASQSAAKKAPLSPAEQEADFRRRKLDGEKEREKQAQTEQQAEGKRENCARAQEMQRTLATGRVSRTDAKGERYYLDDSQLAQESAKARQSVEQWCN
jgi:uncharacterized protein DUF4124